jgi:hypothetical protein
MVSSIALVLLAIGFHLSPLGAFEVAELPSVAPPAPPSESSPQVLTDPLAAWDTARRDQLSGEEHRRKGELVPALEDFRGAVKIMERLVALHPENIFLDARFVP